jgi:WD40 repeat protein
MDGAAAPLAGPYVGLVPFDEDDARFFFGRSREAGIVAANLRSARLTILYGPSGVGKSSLLMAGAVHDLREEARAAADGSPFAVCVFRSWRDDPVSGIQEAARPALAELDGAELPPPGEGLADTLRAWTEHAGTLLVVLDQFEEYFQYHPDEDDGERLTGFAAELARVVNHPSLPVHVLLSIREDAWARLDRFEGHIPSLFSNYLRVEHLDLAAAREAIERPIGAWNETLADGEQPYELEPALVDDVLEAAAGGGLGLAAAEGTATEADAARDRVEAPFLQLVLERLWRDAVEHGSHALTAAQLAALGGARRIVENHLLDALGSLTPAEQAVAADAFRFLVTRSKTKIAQPASQLADWTNRPEPEVAAVLAKLAGPESGRILRAVAPAVDDGRGESYELFHDVLADPILDWRRGFEEARERKAALSRVYRNVVVGVLVALAVVLVGGGIAYLIHQQRQATAANWRGVALTSAEGVGTRLPESLLLALLATQHGDHPDARNAMTLALEKARESGVSALLPSGSGKVIGVAFSPDGRTLASANDDGTVGLVDVATRSRRAVLRAGSHSVISVGWSPDGRILAGGTSTTPGAGQVWMWDAGTHRRIRVLVGRGLGDILSLAFSPQGRTLAAASDTGVVELWDVGTGKPRRILPLRVEPLAVAFSPDGRVLAAGAFDGTVRLWDAMTGRALQPLRGKGHRVNAVAFTPDGRTLAAGSSDGTVRLWNLRTRTSRTLRGGSAVDGLAISRLGTLAAARQDGTVSLWSLRTLQPAGGPLQAEPAPISSVAFSADARTLATGGSTLRLWHVASLRQLGARLPAVERDGFFGVAVNTAGTVAAVGGDGALWLWNARSGGELGAPLRADGSYLLSVAFAPGGSILATGGSDGMLRLWHLGSSRPFAVHPVGGDIYAIAFSADGRTVAAGGRSGAVGLWDVTTGQPLGTLRGAGGSIKALAFAGDGTLAAATPGRVVLWRTLDGDPVMLTGSTSRLVSAAFAPNGDTLAAGGVDGTVWLWSAHGKPLGSIATGQGYLAVAFTADGRTLVTAGADGTLRLWDVSSRTGLGSALTPGSEVAPLSAVALSPGGHTLVSADVGGAVRVWNGVVWSSPADLEQQVCSLVVGTLSESTWRSEWPELAPGLKYEPSCLAPAR